MFSVFRRELKLYFRAKSTHIILTILLAVTGICTLLLASMGGLQFIPVYLTPRHVGDCSSCIGICRKEAKTNPL